MRKSIKDDLDSISDSIEHLQAKLPELTMPEKVDVDARLKTYVSRCDEIDKAIKSDIEQQLNGATGTVMGQLFVANRQFVPGTRVDVTALKAGAPAIYARYSVDAGCYRVNFKPR